MTKRKKATKAVGAKASKTPKEGGSSKLAQLEAMLRRPEGATISQLAKALDWQAHSVRGAMSGSLKKKRALKITNSKTESDERVYRIRE